ncbi:MAG: N-formylglutamate amidohydrolase [Alphaproteobacteria bacterium]|nr:N-formylglutamate amidohydrolase [Alphaproteobacteria bacterium]
MRQKGGGPIEKTAGAALLGTDDPPVFELVNEDRPGRVLLICDHGGFAVPAKLGTLGLEPAQLRQHIGWDIGAGALTRELAAQLGCMAVICGYSRLVIDPNRTLDDPTSIPQMSDGIPIPGNQGLDGPARKVRADEIFHPYHKALHYAVELYLARGARPIVVSIHSYTEKMGGVVRPWHIGVQWIDDWRLPRRLIALLRAEPGLIVGDNEPYSARDGLGYTNERHADGRGLANATLEVRQDHIEAPAGATAWAGRLARALVQAMEDEQLFEVFQG